MTAAIPLAGWIGLGVLYLVLFTVVAAICHAAHAGDQQIQDALKAHRWTWNAQPPEFDFPTTKEQSYAAGDVRHAGDQALLRERPARPQGRDGGADRAEAGRPGRVSRAGADGGGRARRDAEAGRGLTSFDFPAISSSAAGIKPRAPIVGGARGTSSSTTPEDK